MARKVFVSYKYQDSSVQILPNVQQPTWPSDYVAYTERFVLKDNIYKGEHQDEDLSMYTDDTIWNHLKSKIYDSSVTVLLISPNMKEDGKWQRSQWIPWELSYSLRETARQDRTSHRNSIVAVVLPNKYGRTDYFNADYTFPILRDNIRNGYIFLTDWETFKKYPNYCIQQADERKSKTPSYLISVSL